MKIYKVGGAVRDARLGLPVHDTDWVVVGATPDDMIAQGFRPVGNDFPVFLHPETKAEYALARTERKTARGYHGFQFHAGPEVTLEQDLIRRDLTVNAMAIGDDGVLIDPYGGARDLADRVLRHVSPAFQEDPVRILRVARFHARFAPLGFRVADETMALLRHMVAAGEADALVAERVWRECERALMHERPSVFFQTLRECGALARILPELDALFGVPQRADYHPEIDAGIHTLMCVDAAAGMHAPLPVRVATLLHDLGKAATPHDEWPRHLQHEMRGVPLVAQVCERLRIPNVVRDLALAVTRDHLNVHRAKELRAATLHDLLERLNAFKRGDFFEHALLACLSDARGRKGFETCDYPPVAYLRHAASTARQLQAKDILAQGFEGPAVGEQLRLQRIAHLRTTMQLS